MHGEGIRDPLIERVSFFGNSDIMVNQEEKYFLKQYRTYHSPCTARHMSYLRYRYRPGSANFCHNVFYVCITSCTFYITRHYPV